MSRIERRRRYYPPFVYAVVCLLTRTTLSDLPIHGLWVPGPPSCLLSYDRHTAEPNPPYIYDDQ